MCVCLRACALARAHTYIYVLLHLIHLILSFYVYNKKIWFNLVTTVKSANDALAILRSRILSFVLVVTEVDMPEMDGF